MLTKKISPLKLELVSSYEMRITEPHMLEVGSQEIAASPFEASYVAPYFDTNSLRETRDEVARILAEDDQMVVVEADEGAGKTRFLEQLLAHRGADWQVCHIHARIALGERHVLTRLAKTFYPEEYFDARVLVSRLVEQGSRPPHHLVVVDDADNLSVFALRLLLDIRHAVTVAGGRFGLLLAGTPRLGRVLRTQLGGEAESIAWVSLPLLSQDETADFLRHLIASAGFESEIAFDGAQCQSIHRGARGVPLYINRLAADVLEGRKVRPQRSAQHRAQISRRRYAVLTGTGAVIVVIGVGLLLYSTFFSPSGVDGLDSAQEQLVAAVGDLPEVVSEGDTVNAPAADAAPPATRSDTAPPARDAVRAPAPPASRASSAAPIERPEPKVSAVTPKATEQPKAVPKVAVRPAPPKPQEPVQSSARPAAPTEPETTAPGTETTVAEPSTVARTETAVAPEVGDDVTAEDTSVAPDPGNPWLAGQAPGNYTIQLMGFPQANMAADFIARHGLTDSAVAVHTKRSGTDWYLVLQESYPTLGEARAALDALPEELQANSPWVRPISSLQKMLVGD